MAGALEHAVAAALGSRPEPLKRRSLVDPGAAYPQHAPVPAPAAGVGVGDRAGEHLADWVTGRLGREREHGLRLLGGQPANQVHHPAGLPRRDADVPRHCPGFHNSFSYRRLRRSSLTWLRKVRVGANSPSLWPTIDSVMNTGTCLRPSCTAIVCPSISGKIVEVRDQVLSIRLSPELFIASTRAIRRSSTNGPSLLPSPASADDVAVRPLALLACAVAERGHAPRGDGVASRGGRALAA